MKTITSLLNPTCTWKHFGAGAFLLVLALASAPAQNTPPALVCPDPAAVPCSASNGAPVELQVTVADADNDALTVVWTVDDVAYQTNGLPAGSTATPTNLAFTAAFGSGTHNVSVAVTDGLSDPVTCTTSLTVGGTTPPVIESVTATPNLLWPPNHKLRPVTIQVAGTDACGGPVSARIVAVTCNEPDKGLGDGDKPGDWVMTGDSGLLLRAERSGKGRGRIYTITVECTDAAGLATNATVTVKVPHDQGKAPAKAAPAKAKAAKAAAAKALQRR